MQTHEIHILRDLGGRRVSADESEKKTMQEPSPHCPGCWASHSQGGSQVSCGKGGTRQEAPARASGPLAEFRKSPALSVVKEQRQKDFGARPQTIVNADLCKLPR